MDDKKNKQRIRARLKKRFSYVTNLTTISVVVAVVAMIFVGVRYNYALQNYGFVQSDVGEAGKGVAVVADQIRQLAEQSAKSAVDTHELIAGILKEIDDGNNATKSAEEALKGVIDGIENVAKSAKEQSETSRAQAEAMVQAEAGVNQIAEVVQSNSAAAEETSATSEELSAQAETLQGLVSKFTLH